MNDTCHPRRIDARYLPNAACLAAGAVLIAFGIRHRGAMGAASAIAGVLLAGWGTAHLWNRMVIRDGVGSGVNSATKDALAQAAKEARAPSGQLISDIVDETSDDSFPASDPPSWTPITSS